MVLLLTATGASTQPPALAEAFQLPPKTIFDKSMPRYPNVWFYVDRRLASSYQAAVDVVSRHVRERMRAREFFGPFDNPEGCDFEIRLEHLQPWEPREPRELRPLTHAHAFHMRYYFSALRAHELERVTVSTTSGPREFYRVAASAHYEVEHANPHHADVERCPICGRTGRYKDRTGNLVEEVHDPLGLELLLKGTIRGEVVRFDDYDQREVGGIRRPPASSGSSLSSFPARPAIATRSRSASWSSRPHPSRDPRTENREPENPRTREPENRENQVPACTWSSAASDRWTMAGGSGM